MKIIDTNPKTEKLTNALMGCSVRLLDEKDNNIDYRLNQNVGFMGERAAHPYIKHYLGSLDKIKEQRIVVLNSDGTERLGPITIPSGKIPVFRLRTKGGPIEGVQKFIIIGIVDKSSQTLHCLDIHGVENIVTSPPEHGPTKKIDLMPEELARL